ncbi:lytic transglycosylase domain-containing protein [Erwinia amylovora]|uniref:lytic transglycosylase domain-containing protein n=1 Tax=Erwinia amylovora TaxID=552 RepID=UPI0014443AFE|nr:lytic transglycosylase domain-containing protein [Erwinia amylovora]
MRTTPFLRTTLLLAAALFFSASAQAYCFHEAGTRYNVSPQLLRAIAQVESGMKPHAVGYNRDRHGRITSRDFGLMQINSTHLAKLKAIGVIRDERDLLTRPCLNVQTGAWILAQHLQVCGLTWQCLGSYNAGFAEENQARRMLYARKVYSIWLAGR